MHGIRVSIFHASFENLTSGVQFSILHVDLQCW